MNSDIRKFIFKDLQTVEGYLDPPDALVFLALLQAQSAQGLRGGVAEIGVFYGRSYFLFRKVCGDDEKILAIDLFDIDQNADGATTQYDRFIENGARLHLPVDQNLVVRGDSTQLRPKEIVERIGNTRFFSIDGGHMLHHVTSDSVLALDTLAPHGIIAFDDTFNPAWPEVTVGVTDFLRQRQDELAAFCMTKYKTYVCRRVSRLLLPHHRRSPGPVRLRSCRDGFPRLEGSKIAQSHGPPDGLSNDGQVRHAIPFGTGLSLT